jgi:hypothetical protein
MAESTKKVWLGLVLVVGLSSNALAGAGVVAVADSNGTLCVADEPEFRVVRATVDELIQGAKEWLDKAPATKPELSMAFTGYIKFCGDEERKKYFSALIERLRSPQENERVYVLMLLHCRAPELLQMIQKEIAKQPTLDFQKNLAKAKRLIAYQKKTPEPYPTEEIVRRIERKLKR